VVSEGDPALGGVYKLVAVCDNGNWIPAIKISESPAKTPNPGHKSVWRIYDQRGKAIADLLSLADEHPEVMETITLRHPSEPTKFRSLKKEQISRIEPLLVDVLKNGKLMHEFPSIEELRSIRKADVERLDPGVRRLMNPHIYHVSLTERLWDLKQTLITSALGKTQPV
jgi:nicotinate phosphoribosyltransferase